jgi:hypothetical protein
MRLILLFSAFLVFTSPVWARLGETRTALEARLGKPSEAAALPQAPGVDVLRWNQDNKRLYEVWIFEDHSVLESIAEPQGISVAEVRKFLNGHSRQWSLHKSSSKGVAYTANNGAYLAFASLGGNRKVMTVMAVNKAKVPSVH